MESGQGYVLITKWAALEATVRLASERRKELLTRLPADLIDRAAGYERYLSVQSEQDIADRLGARMTLLLSQGGVMKGLWDIAEICGSGIAADGRSIPIKQETVEICEFFDINPYKSVSGGSLLIVTDRPVEMQEALRAEGIHSALIGHLTEGKERIIHMDETDSVLVPRVRDEVSLTALVTRANMSKYVQERKLT